MQSKIQLCLAPVAVVPGISGRAQTAKPRAPFFVAEEDSLTVVPGTSVSSGKVYFKDDIQEDEETSAT